MALRALIFDVDGTLAETEEAHRAAFNRCFAEAGRPWRWGVDAYRDLLRVTGGQQRIRHFADTTGAVVAADEIAAMHARKNELYAEAVSGGQMALRPGVARLIDEARQAGLKLAIATTTSRVNVEALLARSFDHAAAWFDAIVTGEDVSDKKPHPEVYQRTLAMLGVAAQDATAFEDSRNGLLAALGCGIATIVTPSIYSAGEDFEGAALVCLDLDHPLLDMDALTKVYDARLADAR